jgi:hypothetical protein
MRLLSSGTAVHERSGGGGYTDVVGFYYGSSQPPPEDEKGSLKEAFLITIAVFRLLAIPLLVLLGGGAYVVAVFYLFSINAFAGYGGLSAILVVIGAVWLWEKTHPPALEE